MRAAGDRWLRVEPVELRVGTEFGRLGGFVVLRNYPAIDKGVQRPCAR